MNLTADSDALMTMTGRAGRVAALHEPLPADVRLLVALLSPTQAGSPLVAQALSELGIAWEQALEVFRWDAGRLADILRTVDASYVRTEMTVTARFRDVDGEARSIARIPRDDAPTVWQDEQ